MSAQLNINVKLQMFNVVVRLCSLAVLVVFTGCSVKLQICNVRGVDMQLCIAGAGLQRMGVVIGAD